MEGIVIERTVALVRARETRGCLEGVTERENEAPILSKDVLIWLERIRSIDKYIHRPELFFSTSNESNSWTLKCTQSKKWKTAGIEYVIQRTILNGGVFDFDNDISLLDLTTGEGGTGRVIRVQTAVLNKDAVAGLREVETISIRTYSNDHLEWERTFLEVDFIRVITQVQVINKTSRIDLRLWGGHGRNGLV